MRRPSDIAMLVVAGDLALLAGLWAQTQSTRQRQPLPDVQRPLREHGRAGQGDLRARIDLGRAARSPSCCCSPDQVRVAWHGAIAGAGAWGLALLLNDDPRAPTPSTGSASTSASATDRPSRSPTSPPSPRSRSALAPYLVRPLRRVARRRHRARLASPRCTSAPASRPTCSAGCSLGLRGRRARAGRVRRPGRKSVGRRGQRPRSPTSATRSPSIDARGRAHRPRRRSWTSGSSRASVSESTLSAATSATPSVAAKLWHKAMYHDPGLPVFGSRLQQVEHIGFALMLAERAESAAARSCGPASAAPTPRCWSPPRPPEHRSVRWRPSASPTRCSPPPGTSSTSSTTPASRTATSTGSASLVDDDGAVAFDDFSSRRSPTGEQYWRDRDDAALLVMTAQLVGDERAVAAAVDDAREGASGARSSRSCNRRRSRPA